MFACARLAAAGGLDKPAFAATPRELLDETRALANQDASAVVVRDDIERTFDDRGRSETRYRMVFIVAKQAAIDDWGTINVDWSPFYQDKPVIRARVISRDAQVAELDPALVSDSPVVSTSQNVFSDRRELKAPLPRLSLGALVEEEFVIKDREPLLEAGIAVLESVGRGVPVRRTVITISAPVARKVRVVARGFTKAPLPHQTTAHGRATWIYDIGPVEANEHRQVGMPGDVAPGPYIGISTATSWAAVADDYRRIVEKRLADSALTLPGDIKGPDDRQTLDRAVAWLHSHVRYTGIELSDAEIVPWPPAETIKRGFGDCKDKATLLVALLRAAGLRANVALVSTGPGWDLDTELPGLGVFDHAIVRAQIAGKDVWIDATEHTLLAGQLPARDQGRHALVIDEGTRNLVMTPASGSADNTVHETRTFHLAEQDQATVTEVSQETGLFVDNLRSWIRDGKHDNITNQLTAYAARAYSGKLDSFTSSDPGDLTRPFTLTLEVGEAKRAFTGREQAGVFLYPRDALARVPELFTKSGDEADKKATDRTADYAWYEPHVYEIENRIELPPGYDAPQLVAKQEEALGTMSLSTSRRFDHGTIVITYRLDTGKRRLSPAEVVTTRTAVRHLFEQPGEHITMPLVSAALAHQGKLVEAAAESQRLIALHPKEALHYDQLADVYRQAGMGAAARRAARKGVELEPTNGDAFSMLGWHLRRDTRGLEYGADADRKGAIAAYRKAIALDPDHVGAFADLATLLSRDERGGTTVDKREQLEAIAMWRRAKELAKSSDYDDSIAGELLLAGELAQVEAAARAMPESDRRSILLVSAIAEARGAKEALAVASSIVSPGSRKQVLTSVVGELIRIRRYDVMREVLAGATGADIEPNLAAIADKIAIIDYAKLDPADPRTPTRKAFAVLMGVPVAAMPWDAETTKELQEGTKALRALPQTRMWKLLPASIAGDIVAAVSQPRVDGNAKDGWRVTMDIGPVQLSFYVVLEHGKARLVGATELTGGVGRYLFELLDHKDYDGAARWLKRIAGDLAARGSHSQFAGLTKVVQGAQAPSRDLIELAAAVLDTENEPRRALPILKRCVPQGDEAKKLCRASLVTAAHHLEMWPDLEEATRVTVELDPSATASYAERAYALASLHRTKEAATALDPALAKWPDDPDLLRMRITIAIASGVWEDAQPWIDRLLASPLVTAQDLNNVAWTRLYFDSTPAKAKELGARAERMSTKLSPNVANTLAAIEAESDNPYAAWKYLQKAIAANDNTPDDSDWYVIGRIAESYGLKDDAIAAYKRVPMPKSKSLVPTGRDFAQRALARLGSR